MHHLDKDVDAMQVLSSYHSASAAGRLTTTAAADPRTRAPVPAIPPATGVPALTPSTPEAAPVLDRPEVAAGATTLKYRRSERTSLLIETQDGDLVRLKLRSKERTSIQGSFARIGNASSSDLEVSTRNSTKLSLSVRGELDADELAAIQDTVARAAELADDFFSGDAGAAFRAADALGIDGGELARVKLDLRVREHVTYSSFGYARTGSPAELPVQTTPTTAPSQGERVGERAEVDDEDHGAAAVDATELREVDGDDSDQLRLGDSGAPPADDRVDASAEPADDGSADPGREPETDAGVARRLAHTDIIRGVGDFLERLLDGLDADDDHARLDLSLKIKIFQATLATVAERRADDAEASPLPRSVDDAMDALVAAGEPPVDRVA